MEEEYSISSEILEKFKTEKLITFDIEINTNDYKNDLNFNLEVRF